MIFSFIVFFLSCHKGWKITVNGGCEACKSPTNSITFICSFCWQYAHWCPCCCGSCCLKPKPIYNFLQPKVCLTNNCLPYFLLWYPHSQFPHVLQPLYVAVESDPRSWYLVGRALQILLFLWLNTESLYMGPKCQLVCVLGWCLKPRSRVNAGNDLSDWILLYPPSIRYFQMYLWKFGNYRI